MAIFLVGNVLSALAPTYGRSRSALPHRPPPRRVFGVASLVAADMAGPGRRAWAVCAYGRAERRQRRRRPCSRPGSARRSAGAARSSPWRSSPPPPSSRCCAGSRPGPRLRTRAAPRAGRPAALAGVADARHRHDRLRRLLRRLHLHRPDPDRARGPARVGRPGRARGVGARHGRLQPGRRPLHRSLADPLDLRDPAHDRRVAGDLRGRLGQPRGGRRSPPSWSRPASPSGPRCRHG